MRRREALKAFGAMLPLPLVQDATGGEAGARTQEPEAPRLYDPSRVGRSRPRITDYENDPFILDIESRLRCTCGCNLDVYTCRTTDFTCGTSPAMHRQVVAYVQQGMTAQEIIDVFVAEHGEMVLMAPTKQGFNLLAWFLPGTAIASVGVLIMWVFTRRTQLAAQLAEPGTADLSADDQARLETELRDLEF
jgi:cytochrome c-type biogenesis protein CcmH